MVPMINRRSFLKTAALGSIAALAAPKLAFSAGKWKRPNVLFIAIDDMNDWTTLFDKANPIKTPNLERLAARGTFFSRAYCAVAACKPSRTAILTGYGPDTTGCYANSSKVRTVNPNQVTLPQYFRKHGYMAKGAGKIFHGLGGSGKREFWDNFQKLHRTRGPRPNHNGYTGNMPGVKGLALTHYDWGEHRHKMVDYDMAEYIEEVMAKKWDKPMFLAAGIFKPHLPFYAPPDVFRRYPLENTTLPVMPANDLDDVSEIARRMAHTEYHVYSNVIKYEAPDPRSLKRMVQCYQASADFADSIVGRLLDDLDKSGRADNTIIILWSDHGYHLGDKENCVKFTLWEKANHVPFIIVAPGVTNPGTRCDAPVSLLDIYPTLVDLCGLPPKRDNEGHSLVPLLKDPEADWPHPAIMTMGKGNNALRTDRWRYIRYRDGSEELYDHNSDPWEHNNLAGLPEYENILEEHRKWLLQDKAPTFKPSR